jgi:hypothetical protein
MNQISDFLFQLTKEEVQSLISQSAISKTGCGEPLLFPSTEPNKRRIGFHTNDQPRVEHSVAKDLERILGRKATGNL